MIIYKITNKINGKVYIGQTRQSLKRRWSQHCCPSSPCIALIKAITKYGKENFDIESIDAAITQEETNEKEIRWIAYYDSANPQRGYNLSLGGDVGNFNEETRKKMSEAHKGEKNYFYGKHHTEETRRKQSKAKKGVFEGDKHPRAKRIKCVETGESFTTIKAAAEKYKLSPQKISEVCLKRYGRNTVGGFHWEYETNANNI